MKPISECVHFRISSDPIRWRPEISLSPNLENGPSCDQEIMCGYVPVVLQKMFGPTIFADVRIRVEIKTCEWVVEREHTRQKESGEDECYWKEWIRIPGQLPDDFDSE